MQRTQTMQLLQQRGARRTRFLQLLLCCVFAFATLSPLAAQTAKEGDVAIVVHADTPISNLTLAEVRKIFRGDKQYWTTNLPVVLLVRAPVARERDVVLKMIYQMTEAQFRQYWVAKIFRAESVSAPKLVYTPDMANQLVATLPGAISFVDAKQVGSGVKVVRVEGKLPGEAGYPLR
jgi:ABC-type phosphate transport system substrate-binding protein